MNRIIILTLILTAFACSNCKGNEPLKDEFNNPTTIYIAVFGAIQYLTNNNHIDIYQSSLNWILSEQDRGRYFNCILHTGDITDKNNVAEWEVFYKVTVPIARRIP